MNDLLNTYLDTNFLNEVVSLSPAVGVGVILGVIFAILGWLVGTVIRLGKLDI